MCGMQDNNVVDWEYADEFYEESSKTTVRSFEEIAKECEGMTVPSGFGNNNVSSSSRIKELAKKVAQVRALSTAGRTVDSISQELGFEKKFITDVMITISGSPEDDSDIAIAYMLEDEY